MKLILGDCLDEMSKLPDNSVDLIITSPPYEDISGAGYTSKNKDVLFLKLYLEFLDKVFNEYYRLLKQNCQEHMFLIKILKKILYLFSLVAE